MTRSKKWWWIGLLIFFAVLAALLSLWLVSGMVSL